MSDDLAPISELCRRSHGEGGPADALHAITALRARLDQLERRHVGELLGAGATWAQVAETLGITRQAAHSRYRHLPRRAAPSASSSEVKKVLVTGDARSVVRLARQEAAAAGAPAVGTEHLLLALTRTAGGRVARALTSVGINEDALRSCLHPTIVADGTLAAINGGFTRYAREVLEGSLREALTRGEGFIGTDHLLLALLRNPAGGAAQTLGALGIDAEVVFATLGGRTG